MLKPDFDYQQCLATSEKVYWNLRDVMPQDAAFDMTKYLLPDGLSAANEATMLSPDEKRLLSQIRGHSYLYLFSFVEEYIIATTVQYAAAEMYGDEDNLRAMLRFAEEEAKHQRMFKLGCALFAKNFPTALGTIGNPEAVAAAILARSPIAVLLITLHLEIMTQQHYVESIRDGNVDALFQSILKHHWIEESQHAKLDVLELHKVSLDASAEVIETGADDYGLILRDLRGLLDMQADLDVKSLVAACKRDFSAAELEQLLKSQKRAYARTFIGSALTNKQFLGWFGSLTPTGLARIQEIQASLLA